MRYVVGVDTRERSRGAVEFAGWLERRTSGRAATEFVAVQVLDQHVRIDVRDDLADEAIATAERRLALALQGADAAEQFAATRVVIADRPELGLASAFASENADVLIVGRIAPSTGAVLPRLGQVARRIVRGLGHPVIVVPPDLTQGWIDSRAVVVATDLRDDAIAAVRFAGRLAAETGLELVVVHVAPGAAVAFDSQQAVLHPRDEAPPPADVERWMTRHGLEHARVRVVRGDVVTALVDVARQEHAALVVVGSRRLSRVEHIFTSSVGTDLARSCDRAVAIVPGP
jgi:nucleotide-binding universal stress UspA family protein